MYEVVGSAVLLTASNCVLGVTSCPEELKLPTMNSWKNQCLVGAS